MSDLIDVGQVLTQIFGFLIMVWILRRYAWGPLMAKLDERRDVISGQFDEADRLKAEANDLKGKYEQELRTIDAQAREKIQDAVAEGQKVATEIKSQAQTEAQARLVRATDEIEREREKAKEVLRNHIVDLSMRTAEKILRQKMDDPAQRKLVGEFVDEVGVSG